MGTLSHTLIIARRRKNYNSAALVIKHKILRKKLLNLPIEGECIFFFVDIMVSIYDRTLIKNGRKLFAPTAFDFGLKLLYNKYVCDIFIARKFNSNDRFQR